MAFIDGDKGENFMTVLGFSQYGNNTGTFPKICKALADAEGEINTSFFINKLFSNSNSDEKVQRNKDCHGGADDKE